MLKPGETRTATVGGVTIQVQHVAGGSFTSVTVRDHLYALVEPSYTVMCETDALRRYREMVRKYAA